MGRARSPSSKKIYAVFTALLTKVIVINDKEKAKFQGVFVIKKEVFFLLIRYKYIYIYIYIYFFIMLMT